MSPGSTYFDVATGFKQKSSTDHPSHMVSKLVILEHPNKITYPIQIAIHVSALKETPCSAMFHQKTTSMFSYMSGSRLVVPYADLTFRGNSLPNHEYIDLDSVDNGRSLGQLASESSAAALRLITYHCEGNCDSDLICLFVIRSTHDLTTFNTGFFDPAGARVSIQRRGMGCNGLKPRPVQFVEVVKTKSPCPETETL
ncbi:hypothetical protein B0H14DRAFT_2619141 [Mycena olivaceomarginata]|nr:hypothetical protein B0H14DRAFT_2619141 [Mycena olivaceomarginata]